jgi:acetoin utilization deacetylase AcuC-like enzyme
MAIIYHPDYATHIQFKGHPESPQRMEYILRKILSLKLNQNIIKPEPATEDDLLMAHTEKYVKFIKNFGTGYLDGDTYIREGTYDVALLAAGGALTAAEESFLRNEPSFAIVRPPGHHAGPDHGGGFCYFNNVAIASKYALKRSERVAIVDIDAHHGNGTQEIFYSDRNVLYISLHEWGIFPGTGNYTEVGEGNGKGYTVNIPLPHRSGDSTYEAAFDEIIIPILRQFMPNVIFVSIGVDAHYKDTLTGLELSSAGYMSIAEKLLNFSEKYCNRRLVYVLEGGYNGLALSEVIGGIVAMFEGKKINMQYDDVKDNNLRGREYLDKTKKILMGYWKL